MKKIVGISHGALILTLCQVISQSGAEYFGVQPSDASVRLGSTHTLHCTVYSARGMVQWWRNGFGLGPNVNVSRIYPRYSAESGGLRGVYDLTISNVKLDDDGLWECQVGASFLSAGLRGRQAKLTVQVPVDEVTILEGNSVDVVVNEINNITCLALNGRPAPQISWNILPPEDGGHRVNRMGSIDVLREFTRNNVSVDSNLLEDKKRYQTVSQIDFVPSRYDHGVRLRCEAINGGMDEALSATITLNVLHKPEITMLVTPNGIIDEGQRFVAKCPSEGNPRPTHWKWYKNDEQIKSVNGEEFLIEHISRTMHRTTLTCEAFNSVGSAKKSYYIEMNYGPQFINELIYPAGDIGRPLNLTCLVDSNPPTDLAWFRRDSDVILGDQPQFHIPAILAEHFERGFSCRASGGKKFSNAERYIRIMKKDPPKILPDEEQSAGYGSVGRILCTAETALRPPSFVWTKNGVLLEESQRYEIKQESLPFGVRSIVEITSVQDSDFADYNCTVTNDLGSDSIIIKFSRKEMVPLIYIIAGVLVGVLIILSIIIALIIYHRKKSGRKQPDSLSSGSDESVKKMGQPNIKVEFSPVSSEDDWQQQNLLENSTLPLGRSPDYGNEETDYGTSRSPKGSENHLGYKIYPSMNHSNYGYVQTPTAGQNFYPPSYHPQENAYASLPRNSPYDHYPAREQNYYNPRKEVYGTYGGSQGPEYGFNPYARPGHISPANSRLSTNV